MKAREFIAVVGTGLVAGYVGTKVMERASTAMYGWESESARKQEDAVRPGDPSEIAARKTTELLGLKLSDAKIATLGTNVFHYGLGMSWGALYALLQRSTGLHPLLAGSAIGLAMWAIVDEGMTPALGFSAPNSAYPTVTHVRGLIAHLVYAMSTAMVVEGLAFLDHDGHR